MCGSFVKRKVVLLPLQSNLYQVGGRIIGYLEKMGWIFIIKMWVDDNNHKNIDAIFNEGGKSGSGGTWHSIEHQNNNHKIKYGHTTIFL